MKNVINLILNISILYIIYHLLPWPTFVTVYGSIVLCVHVVAIFAAIYIFNNLHKFTKHYERSIIWDFLMAICSIMIYLISSHEITQYLAVSVTVLFTCIYLLRYKTQQLF